MLLCARSVWVCVHLLSPAIGERRETERERPGLAPVGKDVVFVGCKSKLSVWWKPARLTPKHTMTLSILYIVMIRLLGVKIKMYNKVHMKIFFFKSVLVRKTTQSPTC